MSDKPTDGTRCECGVDTYFKRDILELDILSEELLLDRTTGNNTLLC